MEFIKEVSDKKSVLIAASQLNKLNGKEFHFYV